MFTVKHLSALRHVNKSCQNNQLRCGYGYLWFWMKTLRTFKIYHNVSISYEVAFYTPSFIIGGENVGGFGDKHLVKNLLLVLASNTHG